MRYSEKHPDHKTRLPVALPSTMTNRIPHMTSKATFVGLSDTKRLKAQSDALDRTTANLVTVLKSEDLKIFQEKLKQDSLAKQIKTNNEMQSLRNSLKTLGKKSLVIDLDMDNLRNFLFKITDDITALKETSKESLELLSNQEKNYQADLEGLEKRMDEMKVSAPTVKRGKPLPWIRAKSTRIETVIPKKLHQETEAFDKFLLRCGGHTGGWDEADHLLFLKHFRKHKGARLADIVHAMLPDIPPEVVQDHESWYIQYMALKSDQKTAIKQWREAQKKVLVANSEEQQPKQKVLPERINVANTAEKNTEKKQQVLRWKLMKEEQRTLAASQRRTAELERAEAVRLKTRKEHEQQRRAVQAYQQRKRIDEAAERAKRSMQADRERVTDNQLIKMFRERDREMVAAALQRVERENAARAERAMVRRMPMVEAVRDSKRLRQPTEVWRQRLLQRQDDLSQVVVELPMMNLSNLPRLKVPSWRKLAT